MPKPTVTAEDVRQVLLKRRRALNAAGDRRSLDRETLGRVEELEETLLEVNELLGLDAFDGIESKPNLPGLMHNLNCLRKHFGLERYSMAAWPTAEAALAEIRQLCAPEEVADEQPRG